MAARVGKSVVSVLQLLGSNAAAKIIGLGMVAFYARYLTKQELSILPFYLLVGTFAMTFFGFGLRPTILRLLPSMAQRNPQRARNLVHTTTLIQVIGALVFVVLGMLFADRLSIWLFRTETSLHLVRIVVFGGFFHAVTESTGNALWGTGRFDKLSLIQTTAAFTRSGLGAAFVLLWGVTGLAWAQVAVDLVRLSMSIWFLRDIYFQPRTAWYPVRELARTSWPFYLESFLLYFRSKGDSWLIASALGPEALATYFIAKRIPMILTMMRGSVDNVMATEISKKRERPQEMANYLPRLFNLISHTMMPLTMALAGLSPVTILVVAGPEYSGAIIPSIILCLVQLVQLYVAPVGRGLLVFRRPYLRVVSTAGESIAMLGGLVLLAPRYEEVGVTISLLIGGLAAFWVSDRLLRGALEYRFPMKQFLTSAFASAVMMTVFLVCHYTGWPWYYAPVYGLIGVVLFAVLVSVTNSRVYYATLNSVSPFAIPDPVRWITGRGRSEA